jgi:CheY-like chemotaxis protein
VPGPGRRILLVDDDARVREMLREVITTLGYEVGVAERGDVGLTRFKEHPVDLVITDQMMPGMSGLQLAAEIRVLAPTVPIVLLTGYATEAAAGEARRLGVKILSKPVGAPALADALNAALGRQPTT